MFLQPVPWNLHLQRAHILVIFGGRVFHHRVGIPTSTNCVPLLIDLFLYSSEDEFMQGHIKKNMKKLTRSFKFTCRYIGAVLSLNSERVVTIDCLYRIEPGIKDTTVTVRSVLWPDHKSRLRNETLVQNRLF